MEIKPKKCKGIGRARDFSGCSTPTVWRKYGLCPDCYKSWLLTTKEGRATIERSRIKAKKKLQRDNKQKQREWKEKNKSIAALKQEARRVFQEYIRLRDIDELCICCDKKSSNWDAGHYRKAEIYSGVIFDEINCNKQRVYCNQYLHGNEANYRDGLIIKYGMDAVIDLEKRADETRNKKWSREELLEIKKEYSTKLKELKNGTEKH